MGLTAEPSRKKEAFVSELHAAAVALSMTSLFAFMSNLILEIGAASRRASGKPSFHSSEMKVP